VLPPTHRVGLFELPVFVVSVRSLRRLLLCAVALVMPALAYAQTPPSIDAGAIQNQTGQQRRQLEQQLDPASQDGDAVTAPAAAAAPAVAPGGPTFVLTTVEFNESAFLSPQELAAIAAPFVGRPIDFSGIQALINAVNTRYAEMGIVTASASLPEQEIDSGVLKIELVEGRVGAVNLEGATRSASYVRERVRLSPGTVIDVPDLGARIATVNRTGDLRLRTILQPGTDFGLTDVTLSVTEPPRNTLSFFTDNFGAPNVGRYQIGGLFQHYGLLGLDDRLKVYGVWSEGNLAGNASYTFGFAPTGARIGLSYSRGAIRIVDGPFAPLSVNGQSEGGGVSLAQPVYGNSNWLALFNLGGTVSHSSTVQSGITVTDNLTWKGTAGLTLGYYGSRFALSVSPYYAFAHTDIRATGATANVHFFGGSASVTAVLPGDFVLQGEGSWQVGSQLLVTGDQLFQIGGPTTIRGYDPNAAAGGSGYYGSLELHKNLSAFVEGLDVFAFVDHGAVYSTAPARVGLTAVGAGFTYSYRDRISLELTGGFPVGERLPGHPDFALFGRVIVKAF
jgi:hemolysin activation/secretion protein